MPRSGSRVAAPGVLRISAAVATLALCGSLACEAPEPEASVSLARPERAAREVPRFDRPPNLVLVVADDLGYGTLGSYGGRQIETPNLDRMAAEGMRFVDFYAGAASCAPSRSALITGQHTGHTPVRSNQEVGRPDRMPLPDETVTVAEMLRDAGYVSGVFGKWGLGNEGSSGVPTRQGFEAFLGYLDQDQARNPFPDFLWQGERQIRLRNEVVHTPGGSYATKRVDYANDLFTEAALAFMRSHATDRFFVYLASTVPHWNSDAPPGHTVDVPSFEPYANRRWSVEEKGYAAQITRLDRDVGRILQVLREMGLERDTLVLFTSDNGAADTATSRFFQANGALRGVKFDLYEGGIRVPLIARWPGRVPAGASSDETFAFWDLMPTFADLAGLQIPPATDGISMLPALLGDSAPEAQPRDLYWEAPGTHRGLQAMREGRWKAVHFLFAGRVELYDLAEDPAESRDVAEEQPALVATLRQKMRAAHTPAALYPLLPEERDWTYRVLRRGYQLYKAGSRLLASARASAR